MTDDRFDEALREAAQEYNRPSEEAPRDLMWARIEAIRRERASQRQRQAALRATWVRWGIGIAAALAIGFGIGRLSESTEGDAPPVAALETAPTPETVPESSANLAYRLATTEHLSRAEAILTSFRVDPEIGRADPAFFVSVRQLLSSTRLLLSSPAAGDPAVRNLLEDLELMLMQISQLSYDGSDETEIIDDGLEAKSLLPRLRSAIPAGRFEAGA